MIQVHHLADMPVLLLLCGKITQTTLLIAFEQIDSSFCASYKKSSKIIGQGFT